MIIFYRRINVYLQYTEAIFRKINESIIQNILHIEEETYIYIHLFTAWMKIKVDFETSRTNHDSRIGPTAR